MTAEKWKVVGIIMLAVLAVSVGEAMLSRGMKASGVEGGNWVAQVRSVLNFYVVGGTLLMILYFGLYMIALKMADFSFVLPLTAVSFLLGAILAKYFLHENVTPMRWIGTLVIMVGVVITGWGEAGKP